MARPPAPERTTARSEWTVWSVAASIVVEDEEALAAARDIADDLLDAIGAACNRFDPTSELSRLPADERLERGVELSPLLAALLATALTTAERTGGSVDPTLGADLSRWGYDRDIAQLPAPVAPESRTPFSLSIERREPAWRRVRIDGRTLRMPRHLRLDLGATAKAFAATAVAERIAADLGTGVLVSLGGDIQTAGTTTRGGWEVLVQDTPADPAQQVFLPDGAAVATSSTQKRRWMHGGRVQQHILDPRFGTPVVPAWRSVSVAAADCVTANGFSTAAIVRGAGAPGWLTERGAAARLVDLEGRVVTTGSWPADVKGGAA